MVMLIVKVLNAIKSYYVNYKVFPKEIARKRPIYISYKVKCSGLYKGAIEINSNNIYKGMIQIANKSSIGIKGSEFSYLNIVGSGKIVFEGSADFCKGISLNVFDNSVLKIGNNLFCNGGCTIRCRKKISIGSDNMWGWNVCMMDGDGHPIYNSDMEITNWDKEIVIGNKVWLGAESKILKGSNIKDGCVVGFGSVVTGANDHENAILVGCPTRERKNSITWDRGEFPKFI